MSSETRFRVVTLTKVAQGQMLAFDGSEFLTLLSRVIK